MGPARGADEGTRPGADEWASAPGKRSAPGERDEVMELQIRRVYDENFAVYGAEKVWRQLRREGVDEYIHRSSTVRLVAGQELSSV